MTVRGLDLSHNNAGPIDFKKIKAAGYTFVFLKATEGVNFDDPEFVIRAGLARQAGLLVGAYHYGHPSNNSIAEAAHFKRVTSKVQLDLPLVLDIEQSDGTSIDGISAWVKSFRLAVGGNVWVYSMQAWFLPGQPLATVSATRWVARYSRFQPKVRWDVWQNSSTTTVPGVPKPCDTSVYPGSLPAFLKLCGITIPDHPHRPPNSNKYGWVVRRDDHNIYTFAHNRGHTGKRIIELNPKAHPFNLRIGQRLRLR